MQRLSHQYPYRLASLHRNSLGLGRRTHTSYLPINRSNESRRSGRRMIKVRYVRIIHLVMLHHMPATRPYPPGFRDPQTTNFLIRIPRSYQLTRMPVRDVQYLPLIERQ
jgi:hypothetical protein